MFGCPLPVETQDRKADHRFVEITVLGSTTPYGVFDRFVERACVEAYFSHPQDAAHFIGILNKARHGVPNLDCAPTEVLRRLECAIRRAPRCLAYNMLGSEDAEALDTVESIRMICDLMLTAREHRLAGNIEVAEAHEADMERLYTSLPEFARW